MTFNSTFRKVEKKMCWKIYILKKNLKPKATFGKDSLNWKNIYFEKELKENGANITKTKLSI
jgi:hypothetical protein